MDSQKNDLTNLIKKQTDIKKIGLFLMVVFLLFIIFVVLALPCPILFLSGISCPGCGMTRACIHALKFDFKTAFFYHPLWWTLPFAAVFWILFRLKKISRKTYQRFLWIFVTVFLIIYGYRMLFFRNDIIQFHPEHGILPKILHFIGLI